MTNKTRTGTPMVLTNVHGRREHYLLLEVDGQYGVARDDFGNFQGLKKDALGEWKCIKVPTPSEERAWAWARS